MTHPSALIDALDQALLAALQPYHRPQLPVRLALSGGLDSMLLLHRLAHCALPIECEAVHVHHGLQAAADDFACMCSDACQQLGVRFSLQKVRIAEPEHNIEAQARQVRYQALQRDLAEHAVLLTAHHADDQLETLLLALKRGAGLAGLAGIAAAKPLDRGVLLRPWLAFSRAELLQAATHLQLQWIEDPTNQDLSFDRNFLRQQVLPLLTERFPQFSKTAARSVQHLQQAYQQETHSVQAQLQQVSDDSMLAQWQSLGAVLLATPLRLDLLQQWPNAQVLTLLKYYLEPYAPLLEMPQLRSYWQQLSESRRDANPQINVGSAQLYRYEHWLVLCQTPSSHRQTPSMRVSRTDLQQGVEFAGFQLRLCQNEPQAPWLGLPCVLQADYQLSVGALNRRLTQAGRGISKALKDLCKERQIPPWLRQQLPVLSSDDEERQVLWMLGVGSIANDQAGAWLCWQPRLGAAASEHCA